MVNNVHLSAKEDSPREIHTACSDIRREQDTTGRFSEAFSVCVAGALTQARMDLFDSHGQCPACRGGETHLTSCREENHNLRLGAMGCLVFFDQVQERW